MGSTLKNLANSEKVAVHAFQVAMAGLVMVFRTMRSAYVQ